MAEGPNSTITAVPGVRVGHWTDEAAATGCTVVLLPLEGAIAGAEVRGAAPGTRETDLLRSGTLVERVHAVLLGGGSAFGLAAADGVMRFLEERGVGFTTRAGPVPIVPAAILFDLSIGRSDVRPGPDQGYAACLAASAAPVPQGSVGAGAGATIGKALGMAYAVKGGIGAAARSLPGGYMIGALVAMNALGDVIDPETAEVLAGPRRAEGGFFEDSREVFLREEARPAFSGPSLLVDGKDSPSNTTIGVVATDLPLTVEQANRLAVMAHSGIARTVRPSYAMGDGDTLFVLSTAPPGTVPSRPLSLTAVGTAAAWTVERAIVNAVETATGLGGIPSIRDLRAQRRNGP
jgi:L-aminopeptidase/D-esterase-like protein